ncbi:MAG: DUF5060 domain-containing protein, partial [bacterium]
MTHRKSLITPRWLAIVALLVLGLGPDCRAAGVPAVETTANQVIEIAFAAKAPHADAFATIELDVVFDAPDGQVLRVPAFWAGGDTWKVRYASPAVGVHRYRTESTATNDAGLHAVKGSVVVMPAAGT